MVNSINHCYEKKRAVNQCINLIHWLTARFSSFDSIGSIEMKHSRLKQDNAQLRTWRLWAIVIKSNINRLLDLLEI